ncbi:MAG: TatD family hydrolase [Nanoarchaeota archaeon]
MFINLSFKGCWYNDNLAQLSNSKPAIVHKRDSISYTLKYNHFSPEFMDLKLVDVHCHLEHELFQPDLDAVIKRARDAGVKHIICSGVNPPTNKQVLDIAKKYSDIVRCSLGIYPIDALGIAPDATGLAIHKGVIDLDDEFDFINNHKDQIVGIGEVGMDYHWDQEHHVQQKANFERIIEFTEKLHKPIIIHSRKAEADCIQMLKSSRLKKVNLHCFSGNKHVIKEAADAGFFFSIPANIVKAQNFQTLVKLVSLSQLLTETDAPWLSPDQKRNEPVQVLRSIEMIAHIKGLTIEETSLAIFGNYQRIFE